MSFGALCPSDRLVIRPCGSAAPTLAIAPCSSTDSIPGVAIGSNLRLRPLDLSRDAFSRLSGTTTPSIAAGESSTAW